MASVNDFKCVRCHILPDGEVFICVLKHIVCEKCAEEDHRICFECGKALSVKQENPIDEKLRQLKGPCSYDILGCTWTFSAYDLPRHLEECRYRPYKCVGTTLGVWDCRWNGIHQEIGDHFDSDHNILGEKFLYYQVSSVPFNDARKTGTVKFIDAFNKRFLFYYLSDAKAKMVYFIIIYFGRREDAATFYYEFEINTGKADDIRKIKFTEKCVADCEDIKAKLKNDECVALTHKLVKHYLCDSNINFRFIVKKDEHVEGKRERRISSKSDDFGSPGTSKRFNSNFASQHNPNPRPNNPHKASDPRPTPTRKQNDGRHKYSAGDKENSPGNATNITKKKTVTRPRSVHLH